MSDTALQSTEPLAVTATNEVATEEWEIEEILASYDAVSERGGTRAGGTTSCH